MKYTVTWLPDADQELADLRLNAADRDAVSQAANAIERCLRKDPLQTGESRSAATRIAFLPPLAFLFHVADDDRLVEIVIVHASCNKEGIG